MTNPFSGSNEGGAYPPSAFYFKVEIGSPASGSDTSFQEVSGITSEISAEDVYEGGENRFVHKLPKPVSHDNLELKRGIASLSSPLVSWCKDVLEQSFMQPIKAKQIIVSLMNEKQEPIRSWTFADAFPIKWEVESFNSTKNEVAIEKIVFNYSYSNRTI